MSEAEVNEIFNLVLDLRCYLPYSFPDIKAVEKPTFIDVKRELQTILATVNPMYINRDALLRG
jgi:hypothetical protein